MAVNARDRNGHFVDSLQSNDFKAKINGHNVAVLSVNLSGSVHRVVIFLDASGSMNPKFNRVVSRFVSGEIVRSLPGDSQFSLVVFAGKITKSVPFGASRSEILQDIDQVAFSAHEGGTHLWDSLLHAGELLVPSQPGDSVVLVSDGGDNGSKAHMEAVEQSYWANGIRLFFVQIPPQKYFEVEEMLGQEDVGEVSVATGGMVAKIEDESGAKLAAATHDVEDRITKYYLLRIAGLDSIEKPRSFGLDPLDSTGRRRKDVQLTYPQKLLPCAK